MKVQNINDRPNQFIITDDNGTKFLQSYKSIIVKIENGVTYLDERFWNYSHTTNRYRILFLNESTKETLKKIKNGTYILTDLNKTEQ